MGICVANMSLRATGLVLANAYVALSSNRLAVMPQGNSVFTVQSTYNMWTDYTARVANCSPLDTQFLIFTWASAQTDSLSMYTAAYEALKIEYPNYTDVL
jgi:hypothetical protein